MENIFLKKEDGYLDVVFDDGGESVLCFDSWDFLYRERKELKLDGYKKLENSKFDSEVMELRNVAEDIFYMFFVNGTIIQISIIPIDGELEQIIQFFEKDKGTYSDVLERYYHAEIYSFAN